jgi:lipid-binding SYLF domain-containing protein
VGKAVMMYSEHANRTVIIIQPMEGSTMYTLLRRLLVLSLLILPTAQALADDYTDTVKLFSDAGQSGKFFKNSYGYAVFPTIGKGGVGIGGAHGSGRVYAGGKYVGDSSMTQVTVGLQLGGEAFSQVIFFENKSAFDEFTGGNFEFSAQAQAVAITAGASAQATTTGTSAGASGTKNAAKTAGGYHRGMAIFTVAKGGLMYEASVGGQKFSYTPKK